MPPIYIGWAYRYPPDVADDTDDTHAATYCVIIQTQRTQISGRNSDGTKHSGGPPEYGREKKDRNM